MQNLQWYPGHMAKTRRMIEENLKNIDVVLEILDARIPFSGRNPNFDDIITGKPRLVVMNKYDLADPSITDKWISWYQNQGIKVIPISCATGLGINKIAPGANELIQDKNLLFVDDSIVRGTQLKETVDFLYDNGAKSVHIRSACPPIMFGCKYLNFTRATSDMELIARRTIFDLEGEDGFKYIDEYSDPDTERGKRLREHICKELHFASLEFQSLNGIIDAIGIPPENLCTYCWNGKE